MGDMERHELNDMTYWEVQEAWKAGHFNDRGDE
jgi:hypothetical protein